eukprot:6119344-Prymnesium_polylepis.1
MPGVLLPLVLLPLASAASADAAVQRRSRGRDLAKVSLAGAASCSLTHTMVVPLVRTADVRTALPHMDASTRADCNI